jgi:hypothetical protein
VEAAGMRVYETFMKKYEKVSKRKLQRVPPDLDLTPYRDEKDFVLLHRLVVKERTKGGVRPNRRKAF